MRDFGNPILKRFKAKAHRASTPSYVMGLILFACLIIAMNITNGVSGTRFRDAMAEPEHDTVFVFDTVQVNVVRSIRECPSCERDIDITVETRGACQCGLTWLLMDGKFFSTEK